MLRRALVPFLAAILCACGAPARQEGDPVGVSGPLPTAGSEATDAGAVELTLRRTDGTFVEVGELRGTPVLLFVFATFDTVSQLALHPLQELARLHPDLPIIGIAAEPSARLLIEPYEHALSPPFQVTYDPDESVSEGESALGRIEAIPTFIALDARGVAVARHVGFAEVPELEELLHAAR
jgi:hypothetical protein